MISSVKPSAPSLTSMTCESRCFLVSAVVFVRGKEDEIRREGGGRTLEHSATCANCGRPDVWSIISSVGEDEGALRVW
jgi:hypothetical protein